MMTLYKLILINHVYVVFLSACAMCRLLLVFLKCILPPIMDLIPLDSLVLPADDSILTCFWSPSLDYLQPCGNSSWAYRRFWSKCWATWHIAWDTESLALVALFGVDPPACMNIEVAGGVDMLSCSPPNFISAHILYCIEVYFSLWAAFNSSMYFLTAESLSSFFINPRRACTRVTVLVPCVCVCVCVCVSVCLLPH